MGSLALNLPAALNLVEPLDRQTLGERAYAQLADLLMSGRLAPGEKLSLRAAADVLGVSIMPVREAVIAAGRRQGAGGDAEPRGPRAPDVGGAVSRPDQGADRHRGPCGGAGRRCTATAAISRRSRAPRRRCGWRARPIAPDLPRAVELNKTFHFAVYEAAHSPILVEIIRALWLKAGPVINLDLRANPDRLAKGDAIRFHAEVRKAIDAGNGAAAQAGIAADIRGAADFILSRGGLAD